MPTKPKWVTPGTSPTPLLFVRISVSLWLGSPQCHVCTKPPQTSSHAHQISAWPWLPLRLAHYCSDDTSNKLYSHYGNTTAPLCYPVISKRQRKTVTKKCPIWSTEGKQIHVKRKWNNQDKKTLICRTWTHFYLTENWKCICLSQINAKLKLNNWQDGETL